MKRLAIIGAVLALLVGAPASADMDRAMNLFEAEDYSAALAECLPHAEAGDADAQTLAGFIYDFGLGGIETDFDAAVFWYTEAAIQGDSLAQYFLAALYFEGLGVEQSYEEAAYWYLQSAEQGDPDAQFYLAGMYFEGSGVEQSYEEAAYWYGQAADWGHAFAQLTLARMYDEGRGVPQSYADGARYFLMAAEQDVAAAQYDLALDYNFGLGVPEDLGEAIYWYRRAAEQGHDEAQFSMGLSYDHGGGVEVDDLEAAWWYLQAALQGHAQAQTNLGGMYRSGEGVGQDLVRAYMWLTIAGEDWGDARALEQQANLGLELSAAQIDQARDLFQQFQAGLFEPTVVAPDPDLALPPELDAPGASSQAVSRIQLALADLGYDPGPADGIAGPQTQTAIRAFEKDYGLPVTGQMSDGLNVALVVARAAESRRPSRGGLAPTDLEVVATGTGFVVSEAGHVVTNNHVIEGCVQLRVRTSSQQTVEARLLAAEPDSDLALLQAPDLRVIETATFRSGRGIRPADEVVVIGYPLFGTDLVTGTEAIVTTGTVSALAGPGDDRRLMQMTAPVQPGNSGGPLLDAAGNIVGVVVAKLDALYVADVIGDIPQNVNFAIQGWVAQVFLDSLAVDYRTAESPAAVGAATVAGRARPFTLLVQCLE